METDDKTVRPSAPRRSRTGLWLGLALLVGAGALSLAVPLAQAHGMGGGGGFGPHAGPFGGFGPGRIMRVLDKVGATASQKSQIAATWQGLRPELKTLHEQQAQLRTQIEQAMTAPTIDPARIEKLRQQSVQLVDKASAVMSRGVVASAQVLTPEQRKQVLAEMQQHRQRFRGGQGPDGTQPQNGPRQ